MIWLDFGEMRQIVDAAGKDRGSLYRSRDADDDDDLRRHDPLSFLTNVIFGG